MVTTLMIVHGIITVLLIISVLLQFGKGAEAGLFSGGGSDSIMTGAQQGNILNKITTVLAVAFMASSLYLARGKGGSEKSLLDSEAPIAAPLNSDTEETSTVPAAKAPSVEAKATTTEETSK